MRKLALLACSAAMLMAAAPATAAVTFELKDVTLQGGGMLTGDFVTSDDLTTLLGLDITSTAGDFGGRHFNETIYSLDDVTSGRMPANSSIRLDLGDLELQLAFGDLTAAGASLSDPNSSEHSRLAGTRLVTGGSIVAEAPATAAVPEPATWVMMIGGFGLVGSILRRRSSVRRYRTA
jgi:PEP-CTERM motif